MQKQVREHLKNLGFVFGSVSKNDIRAKSKKIDEIITGQWRNGIQNTIYCHTSFFPQKSLYGHTNIESKSGFSELLEFYNFSNTDSAGACIRDFVFLDTETTSLGYGSGTVVFMVGICYFLDDGLYIEQVFMDKDAEEADYLAYIDAKLQQFNFICTFNSKTFDIPVLRSRFILNKLIPSFFQKNHIDILQLSRQIWSTKLGSCRLSELEKQILGFHRNSEEIPGWLVPQIYFDYLKSGDPTPLSGVFYHNECDIVSLALLFFELASKFENYSSSSHMTDTIQVARAFFKKKLWQKAKSSVENLDSRQLSDDDKLIRAKIMGYSLKKMGDYKQSADWFKIAESLCCHEASTELAKYYEHKIRDNRQALIYAKKSLGFMDQSGNCSYTLKHDFEKRITRLERKINE